VFGLTSTLCVQLLNNTAGWLIPELKLVCLWWTGLILRIGTMEVSCDNSNELWVCMKCWEFIDVVRNCQLLNRYICLIGYLVRLQHTKCANGKLHAAQYRTLLHRLLAVGEEFPALQPIQLTGAVWPKNSAATYLL
jgi:hypothetical protein